MSEANTLTISESRSGEVCILVLSGRIDSTNAQDLTTRLTRLLEAGGKGLVIDFADVRYLTSAAFRVLLLANAQARRNNVRLVFCRIEGQVRELFHTGGLLGAFTIHGTREEALAAIG